MNIRKKTGRFFFVNSWDYNFKATVYNSYFESNQRQKPCKLLEIHWLTDMGGKVLGSYFQICHSGIHPGKLSQLEPQVIKVSNPDEFSGFQRGLFHVSVFGGISTVAKEFIHPARWFLQNRTYNCVVCLLSAYPPQSRIPRGTI